VNGEAKRGYFFEIVSSMVYYLKSFQVWVNFMRIWCESDCAELVSLWKWKERKNQRSLLAPLFSEIDEISSSFQFFDFSFVDRMANKVAHECARYACENAVDVDWLDVYPEFLSQSLVADCNKCYELIKWLSPSRKKVHIMDHFQRGRDIGMIILPLCLDKSFLEDQAWLIGHSWLNSI
jgi:hypothetical protein